MKILHADSGREWRGGQTQVYNLLKRLPESIEFHLLVPEESRLAEMASSFMPASRIHTSPMRGDLNFFGAWKIRNLNRRFKFDFVHAHSSHALGISRIAEILFKTPPVIQTRRLQVPVGKSFLSRIKYSGALLHVANSETVKEALIESGLPPEKITVVPSGIELDVIDSAPAGGDILEKYKINPSLPVVGNVGALTSQKDQETFILAAAQVLKKEKDVEFVIAGEGKLRGKLEKLSRRLGISSRVHLIGFVDDIYSLFKSFNLYVNTSLYEGLCGTILQAMACRVPVISSDVRGSRQILKDGETCRVVDTGDVKEFSRQIINILNSKYNISGMVRTARRESEKYDFSLTTKKMIRVYKSILKKNVN